MLLASNIQMVLLFGSWFCHLDQENVYIRLSSNSCITTRDIQRTKFYLSFKNLNLGVILKIFLNLAYFSLDIPSKNIFFLWRVYSYFATNLRLKIFLWTFLDYSGCILKIFFKFGKFWPRYSNKIYLIENKTYVHHKLVRTAIKGSFEMIF